MPIMGESIVIPQPAVGPIAAGRGVLPTGAVNMGVKPTLTAYEIFVIKVLTGNQGWVLVSA